MLLPFGTLSEDNAFLRLIVFLLALISNLHSVITILLVYYCIFLLVLLTICIVFLSHTTDEKLQKASEIVQKNYSWYLSPDIKKKKKPNRDLDFLHQILSERLEFLPLANNLFKTRKYLRTHEFGFMATGEIHFL